MDKFACPPAKTDEIGLIFEERKTNMRLMKSGQTKIFLFFITALLMAGCKKNVVINNKQAILFQIDYENYAWGYQHKGLIIDGEGNVFTYKNPQNWIFPDKDFHMSEDQVHTNLESCLNTGKRIPLEELKKYAGYIKNISSSKVTALKNVAADVGTLEYICYQFSESTGTYKGSLIKREGDFTCENLNFFSKKVSTWLKSISDTIAGK
jgi:hypothetical protein